MVLKILLEILLFLLVVAVAYIVVVFIVCKDLTGTWNDFRFLFDYKNWSFAIIVKPGKHALRIVCGTSGFDLQKVQFLDYYLVIHGFLLKFGGFFELINQTQY